MTNSRGLRHTTNGFTLVEVIVAMGIAATALIFVLCTNHESLQRSLRSRENARLDMLLQSKLNEVALGLEPAPRGTVDSFPNYSWQIQREPARLEGIDRLERITLICLSASQGTPIKTIHVLHRVGNPSQ